MTFAEILKKHNWTYYRLAKFLGKKRPAVWSRNLANKVTGKVRITKEEADKMLALANELEKKEIPRSEIMYESDYRLRI